VKEHRIFDFSYIGFRDRPRLLLCLLLIEWKELLCKPGIYCIANVGSFSAPRNTSNDRQLIA
jgi:hypothetical protein